MYNWFKIWEQNITSLRVYHKIISSPNKNQGEKSLSLQCMSLDCTLGRKKLK